MSKNIEYIISDIEKLKNDFNKNNSLIIEKLRIIEKEYSNMSNVLSTPNSNKIIPEIYNIVKKYDNYVETNGSLLDKSLSLTVKEYNTFISGLQSSIKGGK